MFERVFATVTIVSVLIFAAPAFLPAQITPEVIEAAKKEGEVMFYGAITVNSSKAIGDAFEKKYGIKLRHWRGDATELINRSLAEARAGKPGFDVTLGNEVVMATLDEKNLFAVFEPPAAKGYPKQFLDADKKMTPWRVLPYGINYNHQLVKADEAPQTWEELLLPKWKGQFGMANPGIHVTTLQFVLNLDKLLGPKWLKRRRRLGEKRPASRQKSSRYDPTVDRRGSEGCSRLYQGQVSISRARSNMSA